MEKNAKIYVAGHTGMVGTALVRNLTYRGYTNIIGKTFEELDLTRQTEVEEFFEREKPEYVFLAAARVGGIGANIKAPAEFLMDNLKIQNNIFTASLTQKVKKLIFIGSACVYPESAEQPISEEPLLTGKLEGSHEGYSLAKICGIKACEYLYKEYGAEYMSVIPCNLYGYNDSFDVLRSHIVPSIIRRCYETKTNGNDKLTVWGSGNARRELLFADDLADACMFLLDNGAGGEYYNIGYGNDYSVLEIAQMIRKIVGYDGEIITDSSKPEGTMKRLMDSSKINKLGWKPKVGLEEGLRLTYEWFLNNIAPDNAGGVQLNCIIYSYASICMEV